MTDWYDPQAMNRYAYALNNPLAYIDPDGHAAAYWADAWETKAAESSAELDQMVSAYPSTWPVAAAVQTAMDVGSGFVDMLKLGEGAAEGGIKGYAQDTLRAVGIASMSAGAMTKSAQALKGSKILGNEIGAVGDIKTLKSAPKTLADQAAELVSKNSGRSRVTLRSPSKKMEVDLVGKSHGGVPTPHTKVSPRNLRAPKQLAYNTKNSPVKEATQQDIRTVRRYLERKGR